MMLSIGNKIKAQNSGFTLLELIVVLLVIVLSLSVIFPSLSKGSASLHLKSCSRDILNTFRYAREKAITEQSGTLVMVEKAQQDHNGIVTVSNSVGDVYGTPYQMPKDVQIFRIALAGNETDGPMIVRFLPNGSADNATVLLRADNGLQLRIISDPTTGGGHIESGQGENSR
jgi:prepilin-type N-terminal cleavage/methylation domain-containing protein